MKTRPRRVRRKARGQPEVPGERVRRRLQERKKMPFEQRVAGRAKRRIVIDAFADGGDTIEIGGEPEREERRERMPSAPVVAQQHHAHHPVVAAGFVQQIYGRQPRRQPGRPARPGACAGRGPGVRHTIRRRRVGPARVCCNVRHLRLSRVWSR
ncbi:hypothetical protein [Burkholderia ubonensis]|uniref:hypothetical protein n=1 Tax=Burkholderia ubonensis TaxID=101571 RepID=UPI001E5F47E3|nr:hypothetical protein [Burkholderia ubonensis]